MEEKRTIKVNITNHLTGEITEVEVTSADQAKNLYVELSASESAIKKVKGSLLLYLDQFLGQDDKYDFADGKMVRRVQRTSLVYRVDVVKEVLKENLDKDTYAASLDVITKLDQKATDALVQEMMERGELPGNTLKLIRDKADHKSTKPFIEVR